MNITERISYYSTVMLLVCLGLFFVGQSVQAQQVKSDYQIQKDFKQELKSINQSLDEVGSVSGANQLVDRIKSLETNYSDNKQLLNNALYPGTFEQRIEELKMRAVSVQQRLATIKEQEQKLEELNSQLTSYDNRLNRLNSRSDSLREAIQRSVQSEKQLSDQVRAYRESLERRDELILSIIDSVMIAYKDLNIESMDDIENAAGEARISADGNPLKLIQSIANENVQLLNSNPNIGTSDYLRMNAVQNEFSRMWRRVGDKLAEVYSEEPSKVKTNIENAIGTWTEKVNTGLWSSIHASFEEGGIRLEEFGDSEAFATALNSYVEQGIKNSENGSSQARTNFQNFSDFWNNQVKSSWGEFLTEGEVLSTQEMATIDSKLDQWAGLAEPESNTFVYLFGISVLAVVVLGLMLFREKSSNGSKKKKA